MKILYFKFFKSDFLFIDRMCFIARVMVGSVAVLSSGCAIIRDVEVARKDISEGISIWQNDVKPRLEESEQIIKETIADLSKDYHDIKKDVEEGRKLWESEIKPKMVELEAIVNKVEADIEVDIKKALLIWHKDVESHLLALERVVGSVEADYHKFADIYDSLKVNLRSIKVRIDHTVEDSPVVKHIKSLEGTINRLKKSHISGHVKSDIESVRNDIEKHVSGFLRSL